MIPIRIKADFRPTVQPHVFTLDQSHPLALNGCPVCDMSLDERPTVLVPVGIAPEDQKIGGWTTGGAVAVHLGCTGYTDADIAELQSGQERVT